MMTPHILRGLSNIIFWNLHSLICIQVSIFHDVTMEGSLDFHVAICILNLIMCGNGGMMTSPCGEGVGGLGCGFFPDSS